MINMIKKSIESIILNIINQCKFKINTAESERMDTTTVFHTRSAKKFSLRIIRGGGGCTKAGWRRHDGPSPESLVSDENFTLSLFTLFCRDIQSCRDLSTFWESLGKKVFFVVRNSVFQARKALFHGIYCILY